MLLKLIDRKQEASNVFSFYFEPQEKILWAAGQFLVYKLKHKYPDLRGIQRFFTISSAPFENHIAITMHFNKDNPSTFKKSLNDMKIGDKIEAKGPDGDFVINRPEKEYVFIAGGIGITPFRSIILDLVQKNQPLNITLLYANKTDEFPFKEELEKISSKNPSFKIYYVISPRHIDKELIKEKIEDIQSKIFYVSGPEKMVEDLGEMLKEIGIKKENIMQDYFSGYEYI